MNWLYKLERKFGKFGIPNLMLYVVGGQLIAWIVMMLFYAPLPFKMILSRPMLLHGEIWRLLSFLFIPTTQMNPLFVMLELYLLYWIGSSLERAWGSFKFTVYFGLGVVGAWLACLVCGIGVANSLYYSLFFAFAMLFPNTELLLFFVLPVKVKWLGWIAGALYLFDVIRAPWVSKAALILGLLNFFVFFGKSGLRQIKDSYTNYQRRKAWQNQWRQ